MSDRWPAANRESSGAESRHRGAQLLHEQAVAAEVALAVADAAAADDEGRVSNQAPAPPTPRSTAPNALPSVRRLTRACERSFMRPSLRTLLVRPL